MAARPATLSSTGTTTFHVYDNPQSHRPDGQTLPISGTIPTKPVHSGHVHPLVDRWPQRRIVIVASGRRALIRSGGLSRDNVASTPSTACSFFLLIRLLLTRGRVSEKIPEVAVTPAALLGALAFRGASVDGWNRSPGSPRRSLLAAAFS